MNYRHRFHAGNFADVMKHALLVRLVRALQKKEKGVLILDTHAGRGSYDLAEAAQGDSLARQPEWPDGVGRVWEQASLSPALEEYRAVVREFDRGRGNHEAALRFYPGSPAIARALARPQDRLALFERQPEEFSALAADFAWAARTIVQEGDGYGAVRALLPPPERRALVLIDPPFEEKNEFTAVVGAVEEGLRRMPAAVFALWYPLTGRARVEDFFNSLGGLSLPPTLGLEFAIAGEDAGLRMHGCGLVVVNPPWQFEAVAKPLLEELASLLAQRPGGGMRCEWLVPER